MCSDWKWCSLILYRIHISKIMGMHRLIELLFAECYYTQNFTILPSGGSTSNVYSNFDDYSGSTLILYPHIFGVYMRLRLFKEVKERQKISV